MFALLRLISPIVYIGGSLLWEKYKEKLPPYLRRYGDSLWALADISMGFGGMKAAKGSIKEMLKRRGLWEKAKKGGEALLHAGFGGLGLHAGVGRIEDIVKDVVREEVKTNMYQIQKLFSYLIELESDLGELEDFEEIWDETLFDFDNAIDEETRDLSEDDRELFMQELRNTYQVIFSEVDNERMRGGVF